jgi:hypothetical protein
LRELLVLFAEYGCQSARDGGIIRNNIAADPSEQGGEKREAVEQLHEKGRTREDDRQRDGEADHEQGEVASRDTGEGDDVVEAEDDVCRSTILTTADRLVAAATASSRAPRCTKSLIAT